jgi:hypothetical protein
MSNILSLNLGNKNKKIMNKIKLPKLHFVCSTDKLRPVMQHILVTKEEVVATDGHTLVIHKTSDIFSDEFIEAMPEKFLVHKDQWRSFYNKAILISFENNSICVHCNGFKIYYQVIIEGDGMKYPNYNAVLPRKESKTELSQIGLNSALLNKLAGAILMPWQSDKHLKFEFYGEMMAILVTPIEHENNAKGIIMPVMLPLDD